MNIFATHLWDWLVLIVIMGLALYTMRIIGRERSSFIDDCYHVSFGDLKLMIPNWWTLTHQEEKLIKFERTDTRYDWYAQFQYIDNHQNKSMPDLLEEKLNLEGLEFDMDVVFETDSRVLFRDSLIQENFQEVIRVEGKASQNTVDRIYYDIYLMRRNNDAGYFIFESKSSVLNGLVEGPYFEESLFELSFIHDS